MLNSDVKKENLVFINEVGLDPGIDHFFSHLLVSDLKKIATEKTEVVYGIILWRFSSNSK